MSDEDKAAKQYMLRDYFKATQKAIRDLLLNEGIRLDGRGTKDIRPIWCEVDYLPGPHGSSIFTRGETQSLTTLTLGTKDDEQLIDNALVRKRRRSSCSTTTSRRSPPERPARSAASRREIGHGNLALRALKPMLPPVDDCPYTIRLVSEISRVQCSSSMATVCAGTLALMDGGADQAPRERHRRGLITDKESGKYAVLGATSSATRTTSVIWTSRSPAPPRPSPPADGHQDQRLVL